MNIYILEQELQELLNIIEENEGEVTDELYEAYVLTQENYKAKLTNLCKASVIAESEISLMQNEIKRITNLVKTKNTKLEFIEKLLLNSVKKFGTKDAKKDIWRMELETFKLGTRSSQSIEILDENEIEDRFKRLTMGNLSLEDKVKILDAIGKKQEEIKITIDIPKTLIKEAIQKGEVVEGAKLVTNYSVTVK